MKTDVLVIGGGIVGLMTAWYLAEDGAEVTLVEAGDLARRRRAPTRGRSICRSSIPSSWPMARAGRAPTRRRLRLLKASLQMWQGLGEALGEDLDVKLAGGLLVATTDAQMRQIAAKAAIERRGGRGDRGDRPRDDCAACALSVGPAIGAGFCAMEGKANPLRATPAYAAAAEARGARSGPTHRSPPLTPRPAATDCNGTRGGRGAARRQRRRCGRPPGSPRCWASPSVCTAFPCRSR
jgi:sarcosine oxidase, subunit beta